jgi:hypothetical protein
MSALDDLSALRELGHDLLLGPGAHAHDDPDLAVRRITLEGLLQGLVHLRQLLLPWDR